MEMLRVQYIAMLLSWWLYVTCFAAILRPYRLSPKQRNALRWDFQPTAKRCCHIGERVARKKKICDITILAVFRKLQYERLKYSKTFSDRSDNLNKNPQRIRLSRLSEKVSKCSALFPKYFVKCCNRKVDFYRMKKKCRLMPRRKRNKCRKTIQRKYMM